MKKPKADADKQSEDSAGARDQGAPAKSLDDQRELSEAGEAAEALKSSSNELVNPSSVLLSGLMERS
ncbi:MAG: hypothetical protein CFE44_25165 [Burkholderiales bacterium PBB4]|nr:MAG: hypothetical protein CFE44_25165 [Burkholderiales bacterium PBB4]